MASAVQRARESSLGDRGRRRLDDRGRACRVDAEIIEMTVDTPHLAYLARVACTNGDGSRRPPRRRRDRLRRRPHAATPADAATHARRAGWWRRRARRLPWRPARSPDGAVPESRGSSSVMSPVTKPVSRPRRRVALLFARPSPPLRSLAGACSQQNTPTAYDDVTQTAVPGRVHGQHQRRRAAGQHRERRRRPGHHAGPAERVPVRLQLDRVERPLQRRQQGQPGRPSRASARRTSPAPTADVPEHQRRPRRQPGRDARADPGRAWHRACKDDGLGPADHHDDRRRRAVRTTVPQ